MIQFEELKLSLEELEPDIKDLKEALGLPWQMRWRNWI